MNPKSFLHRTSEETADSLEINAFCAVTGECKLNADTNLSHDRDDFTSLNQYYCVLWQSVFNDLSMFCSGKLKNLPTDIKKETLRMDIKEDDDWLDSHVQQSVSKLGFGYFSCFTLMHDQKIHNLFWTYPYQGMLVVCPANSSKTGDYKTY